MAPIRRTHEERSRRLGDPLPRPRPALEADAELYSLANLTPGDVLLFYTDGLFEATSPEGEPFGLDRIHELLRGHDPSAGSEALVAALLESLAAFRGAAPQEDDITVVVVTFLGRAGGDRAAT